MEFYVANIANYLLEPLYILSFFLLILIFLLLFTNFKKLTLFFAKLLLILFLFFGYTPLSNFLLNKIEDFMFRYNYNDLNTQNGRLKATVRTSHKPINIKEIKEISENNKDLKGEELLSKIFNKEDRPVTTKKVIKRIIPKVSLSLDI